MQLNVLRCTGCPPSCIIQPKMSEVAKSRNPAIDPSKERKFTKAYWQQDSFMSFFNLHLFSACPVPGSVLGTEATKAMIVSNLYHPLTLILSLQKKQVPLSLHFEGYKRSLHLTRDK